MTPILFHPLSLMSFQANKFSRDLREEGTGTRPDYLVNCADHFFFATQLASQLHQEREQLVCKRGHLAKKLHGNREIVGE